MSRLTDLAKGKVRLIVVRKGSLVYETEDRTIRFLVPFEDMGDGNFYAEDKAIYFMKWIKATIAEQDKAASEIAAAHEGQ